jgi:predicted transcriptional regulator
MGGRPPNTSDQEYLTLLAEADAPALFTSDFAEAFDISPQGAYSRLRNLEDDGLIDSRSGQERIWWLTKRGWREQQS